MMSCWHQQTSAETFHDHETSHLTKSKMSIWKLKEEFTIWRIRWLKTTNQKWGGENQNFLLFGIFFPLRVRTKIIISLEIRRIGYSQTLPEPLQNPSKVFLILLGPFRNHSEPFEYLDRSQIHLDLLFLVPKRPFQYPPRSILGFRRVLILSLHGLPKPPLNPPGCVFEGFW